MLDALKNLKYQGGKEGILFFICDVIGTSQISIRDAEIICARAPGKRYLSVGDLITYCHSLGWIEISEDMVSLSPAIAAVLNDKDKLNDALVVSTVDQLFRESILESSMFCYDSVQYCYAFKNELLPLPLSGVRNVLISQGFLIPLRGTQGTRFHISSSYDALIAGHCRERRKQLSLEQLKKQLERNELVGEKAEVFALEYEKKRLGLPISEKVRRISEVDVTAGYDIVSFNSPQSQEPDRFIEVKAVSSAGFHWSKNEYEIAKLHGEKYFLYLIDLSKTADAEYNPVIITNPALTVMDSPDWLIEPESYYIRKI